MLTNRMLSLQTISRNITPYSGTARHQLHTSIKLLSASSSDSSDSGSDSDKPPKKQKPKESIENLKTGSRRESLDTLGSLITAINTKTATAPKINVAIPEKPPRPLQEKEPALTEESKFEVKLATAAKNVAERIGGDVKKTEMDLLDRLLRKKETSDDPKSESKPPIDQNDILKGIRVHQSHENSFPNRRVERIRTTSQTVDNMQVRAKESRSVIRNLLQDRKQYESKTPQDGESYTMSREEPKSILRELQQEQKRNQSKQPQDGESYTMSREEPKSILRELQQEQKRSEFSKREFSPTRVEKQSFIGRQESRSTHFESKEQQWRTENSQEESKSLQSDESTISKRPERSQSTLWQLYNENKRVFQSDVTSGYRTFKFHSKSFGIFGVDQTGEPQVPELSTWAELEKKELKTLLYHPPQNYFQEMIQWTEQGKIWQFPIDNEQGIKEEENVHFSEHVFMERHLKGWCPKKGPIKHFMELVCVGLSKNAFMTVQEKIDHIMWYKDYFGDKRELLVEVGAVEKEEPLLLPKPTKKMDFGPHV